MWIPGVRRACDRYIDPNLPAPTRTTRTGRPAALRSCSSWWRFMTVTDAMRCPGGWRTPLSFCAPQFTVLRTTIRTTMHSALDLPAPAEAGLDERLALLRPGLDQLGLPACVLDRGLRYRYLNAGYEAHVGRAAGDFIGRTPDQVFAQRPRDDRRDQMQHALAGNPVVFFRQTIEGPEAGRWVRAHYLPLRGDAGVVIGVLVVVVC